MDANTPSVKHVLIDKENTHLVMYVSIAVFIVVFVLVAAHALLSTASSQRQAIDKRRAAVTQLKANITSSNQLDASYKAFTSTAQNIIGGDPSGTGPQDGDNAQIVLNALPSGYDFPGLTTSIDNLLSVVGGVAVQGISGTDDELAQSANQSAVTPQAVPIPFSLSVSGSYAGAQSVVDTLNRFIRPVQIQTLTISGTNGSMTTSITAQTFYQPAKSLALTLGENK